MKNPSILTLIPMKPGLHPGLIERSLTAAARMLAANPAIVELVIDRHDVPGAADTSDFNRRIPHTAQLRNELIKQHLKQHHTHVLWIDADIVDYPSTLPTDLLTTADQPAITAPAVLLEGFQDRFYDIACFIEKESWANLEYPWFSHAADIIKLKSVGTVYLVPADVYRNGNKYYAVQPYAEHYSICVDSGLPVYCNTKLKVYHADVTKYGEAIH